MGTRTQEMKTTSTWSIVEVGLKNDSTKKIEFNCF